jgi:hypothetical protein
VLVFVCGSPSFLAMAATEVVNTHTARLVGIMQVGGILDKQQCNELTPTEVCTCSIPVRASLDGAALTLLDAVQVDNVLYTCPASNIAFSLVLQSDTRVGSVERFDQIFDAITFRLTTVMPAEIHKRRIVAFPRWYASHSMTIIS